MAKIDELRKFYESDLELDDEGLSSWSAREACTAKLETVAFDYKACAWAVQIPRRLGGDATAAELSADKKLMRRMMHLQQTLFPKWEALSGEEFPIDWSSVSPDEKRVGAQIVAEEWMRDHLFVVGRQMASLATISIQVGMTDWGTRVLSLLSLERGNLVRIDGLR